MSESVVRLGEPSGCVLADREDDVDVGSLWSGKRACERGQSMWRPSGQRSSGDDRASQGRGHRGQRRITRTIRRSLAHE